MERNFLFLQLPFSFYNIRMHTHSSLIFISNIITCNFAKRDCMELINWSCCSITSAIASSLSAETVSFSVDWAGPLCLIFKYLHGKFAHLSILQWWKRGVQNTQKRNSIKNNQIHQGEREKERGREGVKIRRGGMQLIIITYISYQAKG